jgi:hypothetical protein
MSLSAFGNLGFEGAGKPTGEDCRVELFRRLIQDNNRALDLFDRARQRPASLHIGDDGDALYNVQGTAPTGNSVEATIRRLRKDRPDLHARWLAGELSANAAAIEAGFRSKPTPFEQIIKLLPKLTDDERAELRSMLIVQGGPS